MRCSKSNVLAMLGALAATMLTTPAMAKPEKLIVFTLIDALRPDHMGAYGYERPTTPEMDAVAAEGRRYTRAYVNAPWTRPSTASFLTGLNASRHRAESAKTKLPKSVTTLADRLGERGWTTAGFVANGNGGSLGGLHKGFDVFRDPTNTYTDEVRGKTYNGLPTGEFLIERATRWLRQTKAEKVFLFLFLVDPHDPYRAPKKLEQKFLGANFKGKPRRRALWEINNDYPEPEIRSMKAIYDAAIRYADQAMGTFFDTLESMQLYDDATLILTADHGEAFGEHGFFLHAHHFWDEVIRVPLIIKRPGFKTGVDRRLTQAIDVSQTILDLTGEPVSELPGRSLLAPAAADKTVISEYNEFGIHRQAILGDRYKVIWQRPANEARYMREAKKKKYFPSVSFDEDVVTVYDLDKDPKEKRDLSANMPKRARELLRALKQFVKESPNDYHGDDKQPTE